MRLLSSLGVLQPNWAFVVSCLALFASVAAADVFQWELIDPADPSLGRQESSTLVPDGAGLMPAPFLQAGLVDLTQAWMPNVNLTRAYLWDATLTDADLTGANLASANFQHANLAGAYLVGVNAPSGSFGSADLTGADLSGADLTRTNFIRAAVAGADFSGAVLNGARFDARFEAGITPMQLATTASYQAGDLSDIELKRHDLTGADFTGQNLSDSNFFLANLTTVDFTGAEVRGAQLTSVTATFTSAQLYSTASYQTGDLSRVVLWGNDLTGWDFSGQVLNSAVFGSSRLTLADFSGADLTNANLDGAMLRDANLSGAIVTGANFSGAVSTIFESLVKEQIYATASYQSGDLQGIILGGNNLNGWDLSDQNLAGASLGASSLADVNLQRSNLTDADLYQALLTNTDFTDATIRGANLSAATARDFTAAQFYSTASYKNGDLASVRLGSNDLAGWDLSGLDFTGARLSSSTLTNADLTDATIRNAEFRDTTSRGLTSAQFYSTASYQAGDLSGVNLEDNDLSGWNFSGQNLTGANLDDAVLTGAGLTGADVRDVTFARFGVGAGAVTATQFYSTASYIGGDLRGVRLEGLDLSGWDFSGKSLREAVLSHASLTGADFTDADVRYTNFYSQTNNGLTAAQLYSTASYQEKDLRGIGLGAKDLADWDFSEQNLSRANFEGYDDGPYTQIAGADFSGANLTNTIWSWVAEDGFRDDTLPFTADFTGADTRQSVDRQLGGGFNVYRALNRRNLIQPDGVIDGLDIQASETFRLWDFDSETPVPIVVQNFFQIDDAGVLRVVIEDDDWGSTILFDAGVSVTLDGALELLLAPEEGIEATSLIGKTFMLFDWTGISPVGVFDQITTNPGADWDTSQLYTTGEVTLENFLPGDFDDDGDVDGSDFLRWQRNDGTPAGSVEWKSTYGAGIASSLDSVAVPEPMTCHLVLTIVCVVVLKRYRQGTAVASSAALWTLSTA